MIFSGRSRKNYITVLDIGTSKVCGLMVHVSSDGRPTVIGSGFTAARGIKSGAIVNLDQASECIGEVIGQIERQSSRQVSSVTINVSSSQLKSRHLVQEMPIPDGHPITAADVHRLVENMRSNLPTDEEEIHALPLGYTVDGEQGISDPRGLYAHTLKAHLLAITLPETQLRNLVMALDRCHVEIDNKVATPYAAALAVLTPEEKDIGATVVDMGAGTTSFALFMRGYLVHLGLVPQGGHQLTRDIAQVFSASFATAERLKILNGAALLAPKDELERLIVPRLGEENENNTQYHTADLIKIIIPRLDHILEQVATHLSEREAFLVAARQLVLCGGGSGLQGIKEKTEAVLGGNVRFGRPNQIKNLPNQFDSYTFLTCTGLLKYALSSFDTLPAERFDKQIQQKSRWRKVLQWLVK